MLLLLNLLLLFHSSLMCCTSAESSIQLPMYSPDYSIGVNEPMKITGAEYHTYEHLVSFI